MQEIEIHSYARQLLEAHGARAIAEAAQNAIELESKGEIELARTSRHIEDAMKLCAGRTKAESYGLRMTELSCSTRCPA